MTDYKRNISDVMADSPASSLSPDAHDDKKAHTKPGRKPIETEPKSKRTAQNRAAQRAYRERKERKMKELEDKVKDLEDVNIKISTDSDYLQAQVEILKGELSRYRGHSDFSDLKLPKKVGHLSNPKTGGYVPKFEDEESKNSLDDNFADIAQEVSNSSPSSTADFPWSKEGLSRPPNKSKHTASSVSSMASNENQFLVADVTGSSSFASPLNNNILVSPDSSVTSDNSINNHPLLQQQIQTPSNFGSINLDFTNKFDEKVDDFCNLLNQACGTKERPQPQYQRGLSSNSSQYERGISSNSPRNQRGSTSSSVLGPSGGAAATGGAVNSVTSPLSNLVTPSNFNGGNMGFLDYFNDPFPMNGSNNQPDALSFLMDTNFDVDLAFGASANTLQPEHKPVVNSLFKEKDEVDPLAFLTTEESMYDPLTDSLFFDEISKVKTDVSGVQKEVIQVDDDDDDNEVVPAPESTVRCSEIWDRITSHPRYTEIDIDGLCLELKAKAKCSEKGVVINSSDVNLLLEQSTLIKR